jgi:hypothetical protein
MRRRRRQFGHAGSGSGAGSVARRDADAVAANSLGGSNQRRFRGKRKRRFFMRLHGTSRHDNDRRKRELYGRAVDQSDPRRAKPDLHGRSRTQLSRRDHHQQRRSSLGHRVSRSNAGAQPHPQCNQYTSDKYTTAAALYVFYNSISSTKQDAFDTWDFTTIRGWVSALEGAPLAQETALLNDIVSAQAGGRSLYPSNGAAWAPPGTVPNATIKTDLDNVKSAVTAAGLTTRLPQRCAPAGDPCAVPTP